MVNQWISGSVDQWISGSVDQWISGSVDQCRIVHSFNEGQLRIQINPEFQHLEISVKSEHNRLLPDKESSLKT
jgi:hypothetical protein